jgi:O-antigen biosynthesis protein
MTHEELKALLNQTQQALNQANSTIAWMESSKFWKLRSVVLGLRQKLLSLSQRSDAFPTQLSIPIPRIIPSQGKTYADWQQRNIPRPADLKKLAETIDVFSYKPLISVIVPVFNPSESFLRDVIESVRNQIYLNWELCIADDASTLPHVRQVLEQYQAQDSRIKVQFRDTNGHIARCSNSALDLATGEFVALLDHDDLLTPDALYEVVLLINRHPMADMIYSDEDKIDEHGRLKDPFFKPDWSPDSFLSKMYTCHLGVYRRALVTEIGGFRPGFEGSQDYDLVLRVTEKTKNIFHIPKILYHWRIHNQSVASGSEAKPYAYQAAEKALEEALVRRQEPGRVIGVPGYLGHYCIRYAMSSHPRISIIIPTRDLSVDLDRCLRSIFTKSTYPNYEVLVIDNNSVEASTAEVLSKWAQKEPDRFNSLAFREPFNFSKINNYAVRKTQGELLVFLNNDTEVITHDWLEAMAEQAHRPTIGAVGSLLLYPDRTIQHAGITLGLGGVAGHGHYHASANSPGYFGQLVCITNFSAVTAACLMCRREVFEQVGRFEEALTISFNDVDLCLKMIRAGYYNVYLSHLRLYHYESRSRGYETTPEKQARFQKEEAYMRHKWGDLIENDPFYSPHLTRTEPDFSLNV